MFYREVKKDNREFCFRQNSREIGGSIGSLLVAVIVVAVATCFSIEVVWFIKESFGNLAEALETMKGVNE